MPLRDYLCPQCGHLQESLIRHEEDEDTLVCDRCGGGGMERQLSAPAAYGFGGGGGACDTGGG